MAKRGWRLITKRCRTTECEVDPEHHRLDVRRAPMLRALAAYDVRQDRWLMQLLVITW